MGATFLLAGATAVLLPVLASTPAKAQCPLSSNTDVYTVELTTGPLKGTFDLCVLKTSYVLPGGQLDSNLISSPWFTSPNGQAIAKNLADALVAKFQPKGSDTPVLPAGTVNRSTNGNSLNLQDSGPFFLWDAKATGKGRELKATAYDPSFGNINASYSPVDINTYSYWVLDAPGTVPGPLPLLGAGAAFGWSRRLRRKLKGTPGGLDQDGCELLQPPAPQVAPLALVPQGARSGFALPEHR